MALFRSPLDIQKYVDESWKAGAARDQEAEAKQIISQFYKPASLRLVQTSAGTGEEEVPEQFDFMGAINGLASAGHIDKAKSLADLYSAQQGKAERFGTGGDLIIKDGKQFRRLYSDAGGTKDLPIEGEVYIPTLERADVLKREEEKRKEEANIAEEGRALARKIAEEQRAASLEFEKGKASAQGKAAGEAEGQKYDKQATGEGALSIVRQMQAITADPSAEILGSTYKGMAQDVLAKRFGIGADNPAYETTRNLRLLGTQLKMAAKPSGSGNPTPSEWDMFGQTIAHPDDYPDITSYRKALEYYAGVLEGRLPFPDKYKSKKEPAKKADRAAEYADYKNARARAYKSGNMELVKRMDAEARADGLIK